jgi:hypothetical protein
VTTTNSLSGAASTENVAERLTTAFDLQKLPTSDLSGQGAQWFLLLKLLPYLNFMCEILLGTWRRCKTLWLYPKILTRIPDGSN